MPSSDNIMIIKFGACAEICGGHPWMLSVMDRYKLLTLLFSDTSCTLQSHLAAVILHQDVLTFSCSLHRILAAFGFMDTV
jgi:hypothetical protein